MGIPSPGEKALVLAAVLASQHKLQIWLVLVIGIASAILGDNIGYLLDTPMPRTWMSHQRLDENDCCAADHHAPLRSTASSDSPAGSLLPADSHRASNRIGSSSTPFSHAGPSSRSGAWSPLSRWRR